MLRSLMSVVAVWTICMGCAGGCPESDCTNGLRIMIESAPAVTDDTWLNIILDDETHVCKIELGGLRDCDTIALTIYVEEPGTVSGILLTDQFPDTVAVRLVVDGDPVLDTSFRPTYLDDPTVDEACGPCREALEFL